MNIKSKEEKDLEWGGKLVFINSVVGGAIDMRFMPAILKGVMERMEQGPLTGSYARDVRVIVYDGKMHPVDSNEFHSCWLHVMPSQLPLRRLVLRCSSLSTTSRFSFLPTTWVM